MYILAQNLNIKVRPCSFNKSLYDGTSCDHFTTISGGGSYLDDTVLGMENNRSQVLLIKFLYRQNVVARHIPDNRRFYVNVAQTFLNTWEFYF